VGLKLNGTYQLLVYTDDANPLGDNIHITKKSIEAVIEASKKVGLEVNAEKMKYYIC
jgi:biotin operon repressor